MSRFSKQLWIQIVGFIQYRLNQKWRGCRRVVIGCLASLLLLLMGLCGLLFWVVQSAQAQTAVPSPQPSPLAVYLLIDNSQSMFDLGSIGSDPELLRIDAARLFISYLGVDSAQPTHQSEIIFFGTDAERMVPMMPLANEQSRAQLLNLIQGPPVMGWTDQAQALELAIQQTHTLSADVQPVIILLTDGKPEWNDGATPQESSAYAQRLRRLGATLSEADIPLYIILLANEATEADAEIENIWTPVWQEIATPSRFYRARQPQELIAIYHDIVVALTGKRTGDPILQADIGSSGLHHTLVVEPELARMTLVVSKSNPSPAVTVIQPNGRILETTNPSVRHTGQSGSTLEEIWVIEAPAPGDWSILVNGEGSITVWKDYQPLPTASAQPTSMPIPLPTATPPATVALLAEPTLTSTATAVPTATRETAVLPTNVNPQPQARSWHRPILLLLIGSGLLASTILFRRQQQPHVTGTLQLLSGPGLASGQSEIELETFKRRKISLGSMQQNVPMVEPAQSATLYTGAPIADIHQVFISGTISVNGEVVVGEHLLQDGDIITIGQTRLQYTNLRLHAEQNDFLTNHSNPGATF